MTSLSNVTKHILTASVGACLLAAPLAVAQRYTAAGVTGEEVAAVVRDAGYRAELTVDNVGDPLIETAMSGVNVDVFFYNCDGERCEDIQFSAGFDLEDGTNVALINDWNKANRFGRAYLDEEDDPFIQIDLQVGPGGTAEHIKGYVSTADVVIGKFAQHIGWN